MTRKDYIDGLEKIRKQIKAIGAAFASVDLTDATDMESERRKKTQKLVSDLGDRLYEDIAISAKVAADKAEAGQGEQGDLFDNAAKAKAAKDAKKPGAATDAEVVDVPAIERKPLALPPPPPPKKPTKKDGKGKADKKNGKDAKKKGGK